MPASAVRPSLSIRRTAAIGAAVAVVTATEFDGGALWRCLRSLPLAHDAVHNQPVAPTSSGPRVLRQGGICCWPDCLDCVWRPRPPPGSSPWDRSRRRNRPAVHRVEGPGHDRHPWVAVTLPAALRFVREQAPVRNPTDSRYRGHSYYPRIRRRLTAEHVMSP